MGYEKLRNIMLRDLFFPAWNSSMGLKTSDLGPLTKDFRFGLLHPDKIPQLSMKQQILCSEETMLPDITKADCSALRLYFLNEHGINAQFLVLVEAEFPTFNY